MTAPIIHLNGLPASGKRTVGKTILEHRPGRLLDNHLFLDFVAHFVPRGTTARSLAVTRSLDVALSAIETHHDRNNEEWLIFTNVLCEGFAVDAARWARIQMFAEILKRPLIPVTLLCSQDTLLDRVENPDRKDRRKLTDRPTAQKALLVLSKHPLLTFDTHPHHLFVDTDTHGPQDAAKIVIDHVQTLACS